MDRKIAAGAGWTLKEIMSITIAAGYQIKQIIFRDALKVLELILETALPVDGASSGYRLSSDGRAILCSEARMETLKLFSNSDRLEKTIWCALRALTDLNHSIPAPSYHHVYYNTEPFLQHAVAAALKRFIETNSEWRPYPGILVENETRWKSEVAAFASMTKVSNNQKVFYERVVKAFLFQDFPISESVLKTINTKDSELWLSRWLKEAQGELLGPESKAKVFTKKDIEQEVIDKLRDDEDEGVQEIVQSFLKP